MAFGPGTTTGTDLTRKGSLKAQWPEADALENLKGLDTEAEAQPVINADAAIFNLASSDGNLLRHNFAAAVRDGTLGVTQVSVQLGPAADTVRAMAEKEKEERRKQDENLRFMRMMKALNDRLAELEKEMADLAVKLRAKYGEDFIGGMAAAHLSEEELGRAQSEEERLKLLAEKFLESDGKGGYKVKEEYKDSDEAQYVLRWQESEMAVAIANKIPQGDSLTLSEERYVNDFLERSDLNQNRAFASNTENSQALNMAKNNAEEQFLENPTSKVDINSLKF